VSLAFPILFLLIAIGGGFTTTAGAILIAQHTGAKRRRRTDRRPDAVVRLAGRCRTEYAGLFRHGAAPRPAPADAATQAEIIPLAAGYLRIFFLGLPFLLAFSSSSRSCAATAPLERRCA